MLFALTIVGGVGMGNRLAEFIVVSIVLVWLLTVVVAVIDPSRSELAVTLAPIMGTIAGGAIAVLTIARKANGSNGK